MSRPHGLETFRAGCRCRTCKEAGKANPVTSTARLRRQAWYDRVKRERAVSA